MLTYRLHGGKAYKMKIKLAKCAYIFDYTLRLAYTEREKGIYKYLRGLYDNDGERDKWIDAQDFGGLGYAINLYGEPHYLNDIQIAATDDPDNVINHRKAPSAEKVEHYLGRLVRKYKDHFDIYSDHLKTFNVEVFMTAGCLGYIRAHFNRESARFIIDDRDGALYTSGECQHHEKTNERELARRLGIRSDKAKKEFRRIIEALRNA